MDNIISKLIYTALSFTLIISVFSIIGVNVQAQLKSPNSTAFLSHSPGDLLSLNLNLKRIETQLNILINKIFEIKDIIHYFNTRLTNSFSTKEYQLISSQTIFHLLNDAKVSYGLYINSSKSSDNDIKRIAFIDFENSFSLVNISNLIYNSFKPEMRTNQTQKIDFYFTNLKNLIMSKVYDVNKFTGMINSIATSLFE